MRRLPRYSMLLLLAVAGGLSAPASPAALPATAPELIALAEQETPRLRDPAQQVVAYADIALSWRKLNDPRWEKSWAEALRLAPTIAEPVAQALAWRTLAVRQWSIAPDPARELFARALKQAGELKYVAQKALALREIGHALIGLDNALARQTLDQAAAAARTVATPVFRAASLRDLAAVLAPLDQPGADKLFAEAAALLPAADPDETVQLAHIEVAAAWCRYNLTAALAEADLIGDPRLQDQCYRRMCEALAEVSPDEAMAVVARIHDPVERPLALVALAAALAARQPETAAGMARAVLPGADKMTPEDRQRVLVLAAEALAPLAMPEALELLQKVEDELAVGDAMRHIIVRLAQKQPDEAVRVWQGVADWEAREATLVDILPVLAATDADRASTLSGEIVSRRERIKALLILAAARAPQGGQ